MKIIRRRVPIMVSLIALGSIAFFTGFVWAAGEDYPTKPVTVLSGYAPGGSAANSALIFAEGVKKYLPKPQPFVVIHKPGATGMVAGDYFMKQPADGYTLWWPTQDHAMKMATEPEKFSFTYKDFNYIGTFAYSPYTLTVNIESPLKTFEDFIDYAKKHPMEMTFSSTGIASANHLTLELLMKATGIKITHVPFPSGTQGTLALLGGHVTSTGGSIGMLGAHIKAGGRGRPLVLFDAKRHPDFPEVPTAREKGYDIISYHYVVLVAKKGTPKPVLDFLMKAFKQTAEDPVVHSALHKASMEPLYLGPEETLKLVLQDYDRSREVFGKTGQVGK